MPSFLSGMINIYLDLPDIKVAERKDLHGYHAVQNELQHTTASADVHICTVGYYIQ